MSADRATPTGDEATGEPSGSGRARRAPAAAGPLRDRVALWSAGLLRRGSTFVLGPLDRGGPQPSVVQPHLDGRPPLDRGGRSDRFDRERAVATPRWLRSVRRAALGNVSATYLLVPLLVRALPSRRDAVVLPLHRTGQGRRGRVPVRGGPDVAPLDVPSGDAGRSHQPRRLPPWVDRSGLSRVSSVRQPRTSHAPVARSWPPRPAAAAGERRARGRADGVPAVFAAREGHGRTTGTPADRPVEQPRFPIDVVYTWVDDRDPAWRARYDETLRAFRDDGFVPEATGPARFRNRDELRYSLRSLALHAPFVRNVYILTAGQVPSWLDPDAPNLRVVPHEEILEPECLPTFNSHAIESALHRIDGLAEHYLYLNDDFFFGRTCHPSTFFTSDGRPRLFPDPRATVPDGPCSPADRAVDSASKNTREIMWSEFDFVVRHKMRHVPYPQRRSVLDEMEQRFPWVFKQTARNPFRHHTDVNIPSCLSHYYAFVTGAAVPGRVPSSYINIGSPWAQLQMNRLLQRADRDVFCLNDCPMSEKRRAIVDASVTNFLESYFPTPSPFEIDA